MYEWYRYCINLYVDEFHNFKNEFIALKRQRLNQKNTITMKTAILLLLVMFSFAACKKSVEVTPLNSQVKSKVDSISATKPDTVTVAPQDTIPDNAAFRLKLFKDNSNYDETLFMFKKAANLNYTSGMDAAYMVGFGQESLASISKDGKKLSIYSLPFTPGMAVALDVESKNDGAYSLQISYQNKMPSNIQVWVKDTYLKDSVNVCTGNYNFTVTKADTNSFGTKRFKLIIK